jgi:hypothetical protein
MERHIDNVDKGKLNWLREGMFLRSPREMVDGKSENSTLNRTINFLYVPQLLFQFGWPGARSQKPAIQSLSLMKNISFSELQIAVQAAN